MGAPAALKAQAMKMMQISSEAIFFKKHKINPLHLINIAEALGVMSIL
jgi:hypothetical protein